MSASALSGNLSQRTCVYGVGGQLTQGQLLYISPQKDGGAWGWGGRHYKSCSRYKFTFIVFSPAIPQSARWLLSSCHPAVLPPPSLRRISYSFGQKGREKSTSTIIPLYLQMCYNYKQNLRNQFYGLTWKDLVGNQGRRGPQLKSRGEF